MNERRDWAPVDWSPMKRLIYLRGNGATGGGGSPMTVTGTTPLLMPGALAKPMRKATFAISPVQSGSGDPSPSNVRPITGWTGCTAWVSGKNMFDPDSPNHWVITSQYVKQYDETNRSMVIPCKQGDKYTISCQRSGSGQTSVIYYAFADEGGNILSRSGTSVVTTLSGTTPANTAYLYAGATHVTDGMDWVQLEVGSTASPYTPYSGTTVSVAFPASVGTVYGGTVDPVTGILTVTHTMVELTGSETISLDNWEDSGFTVMWYNTQGKQWIMSTEENLKCEMLKPVIGGYRDTPEGSIRCIGNDTASFCYVLWKDTTFFGNSIEACKAKLAELYNNGTPLRFVMQMQPRAYLTYQIDPQSLTPPTGDAYIWADCGSSAEVTYIGKQ